LINGFNKCSVFFLLTFSFKPQAYQLQYVLGFVVFSLPLYCIMKDVDAKIEFRHEVFKTELITRESSKLL